VGFLTSLFGGSDNAIITIGLALGIVLVLIVLGVWVLKLLFNATGSVGRGRNKRLAVIDVTSVDQKRQLVLIRRDNVEHLVMIGGAQDMVVETGIEPPLETQQRERSKRRSAVKANPKSAQKPAKAERKQPVTPKIPEQIPEVAEQTSANPLARLRELGRPPAPEKRKTSLRHTGLLRPVARVEPEILPQSSQDSEEKPEAKSADSATKAGEAANSGKGKAARKNNSTDGNIEDGQDEAENKAGLAS